MAINPKIIEKIKEKSKDEYQSNGLIDVLNKVEANKQPKRLVEKLIKGVTNKQNTLDL